METTIESEFRAAALAAGVNFNGAEVIADGIKRRFQGDGDKRPTSWAQLFSYGAGAFCNYRTGISGTWKRNGRVKLSKAEREDIEKRSVAYRAEVAERQRKAADGARRLYESAGTDLGDHPYLRLKRLSQGYPARRLRDRCEIQSADMRAKSPAVQLASKQRVSRKSSASARTIS